MSFLTPIAAAIAAGIVLPLLFILYFLKLRRAPRQIASTLLWQRTVRDLQVNAPFQRLRVSLLFFLQLLIVALLLLALGGPVFESSVPESSRLILLIDRSASMSARDDADGARTRLDQAKQAASEIVRRLEQAGGERAAMVIAFGSRAQVVHPFDSNATRLERAISSIEESDETADFDAALKLAEAFASGGDEETGALPAITLLSDGAVAMPSARFSVRAGDFRFVRVGPEPDATVENRGIATFEARRAFDDAGLIEAFVRVVNSGSTPFRTSLSIRVGDRVVHTESIEIPAAESDQPGEFPIATSFRLEGGAVLTASLTGGDVLSADDIAAVVMPPSVQPRVLAISADGGLDPYLEGLLSVFDAASIRILRHDSVEAQSVSSASIALDVDLVVFDGVAPSGYPSVPSITFGAYPPESEPRQGTTSGGQRILSWNRQHALMRNVELDELVFSSPVVYEPPADAVILAQGREAPMITLVRRNDQPHIFVGFTLAQSNWPILPSILVFTQNLLDRVGLGTTGQNGRSVRPGDPVTVRPLPGTRAVSMRGPNGVARTWTIGDGETVMTLPPVTAVGLYSVEGVPAADERIAVSMLSDLESDVRTRMSVRVNAQEIAGGDIDRVASRELWPWFVLAAFVLFIIEWIVYSMQTRVS